MLMLCKTCEEIRALIKYIFLLGRAVAEKAARDNPTGRTFPNGHAYACAYALYFLEFTKRAFPWLGTRKIPSSYQSLRKSITMPKKKSVFSKNMLDYILFKTTIFDSFFKKLIFL